jgi:uncharacterized protein YdcH (DUF465 family)
MKLVRKAIDKIANIFIRPKTYMNYLNEAEFNELLELMYGWYRMNYTLESIFEYSKNNKDFKSLMTKLKTKSVEKLPRKLYRGFRWKTERQQQAFIKKLEAGKFPPKQQYSSWTTSKRIAKKFTPVGEYGKRTDDKYGILLEINPRDFKEDIVFSTDPLFKSKEDINTFLKLVLVKYHKENLQELKKEKPNFDHIHDAADTIQGSIYSVEEKEYVLKNPSKNIDKIKYTIINRK